MSNESRNKLKKSLISGLILIIAAIAVSGAAYAGVISNEAANIINPILVTCTVFYNAIFVAQVLDKK